MHSNCIRAAFERQFKDFDGIRGAFGTFLHSGRDVPTPMIRAAFVRQSRGNLKIPTAFEVHPSWIL